MSVQHPLPDEQPSDHLSLHQMISRLTNWPTLMPLRHLRQRQHRQRYPDADRPLHPVESSLGIRFCNLALLERAFIHRSFLNELLDDNAELVDNERLEFWAIRSWAISSANAYTISFLSSKRVT